MKIKGLLFILISISLALFTSCENNSIFQYEAFDSDIFLQFPEGKGRVDFSGEMRITQSSTGEELKVVDLTISEVDSNPNFYKIINPIEVPYSEDLILNVDAKLGEREYSGSDSTSFEPGATTTIVIDMRPSTSEIVAPEMVLVEGGTFEMGDHFEEGNSNELPVHYVSLSNYYIGKFEITQNEYQSITGSNPSQFQEAQNPVESINWYDAINYCNDLSEAEGLEQCYTIYEQEVTCDFSKNGYRLPTEAEWEYAARGGKYNSDNYRYSGCSEEVELENYGWTEINSNDSPHQVGLKSPNQLDIYDMSGNIGEWCWDYYKSDYYSETPYQNPTGPSYSMNRTIRGGSWSRSAFSSRVSVRGYEEPILSSSQGGFRIARNADTSTNIPPSCYIIRPYEDDQFELGSTISIETEAFDEDGTIESVKLFVDSLEIATLTEEPYNYNWDTTSETIGNKEIMVIAEDNDGTTTQATVTITVIDPNNIPPIVSFEYPEPGTNYNIGDEINIYLSASDEDGEISTITLSANGNHLDSLLTEPYQYTLNTTGYTAGELTLSAIAIDNNGGSATATITVNLIENGPEIEMVLVEGGTFEMGDRLGEGEPYELPLHEVTLGSFMIGKFEVTQSQWENVTGENPSYFPGNSKPVEQISWFEAVQFCNSLSEMEGLELCYIIDGDNVLFDISKTGYRLPTEAEWEYAARGGINHSDNYRYSGCHTDSTLNDYGWYNTNSSEQTNDVGLKLPNQLGIYDMSGNVYEFCWDWYSDSYYNSSAMNNPTGPENGSYRVLRGGSWGGNTSGCRVAHRGDGLHIVNGAAYGFRLARTYYFK